MTVLKVNSKGIPKFKHLYSGGSLSYEFELIDLIIGEGALEILKFLKEVQVGHFNDFRSIKNSRKNKQLSANTISTRLKELVAKNAVERIVSTSKSGRNVVAYKITKKGNLTLDLASKFEAELKDVLD